ncbi:MAG TPA: toll/interleukin-1 receptor domain-containing protein [Polyangiaceae bacterium]|nr:toll/interleukin-1 receptor domain-containing protein [Polyangiaceae bacterium]
MSYAHIDNEAGPGAVGWVDSLIDRLCRELQQRLGRKDVSVWIDRRLTENRPLTPEILDAVKRSATMLVIMSPSYLNSEWCARERTAFLSMVKDRVAQGSVFLVHARPVDRKLVPSEFGDLTGFQFWVADREGGAERPLGVLEDEQQKLFKQIFALSHKLKEQFARMKPPPATTTIAPPSSAPRPVVFVARSSEDLEDREEELRTYLEQRGCEVLPRTFYSSDSGDEYREAMVRDLARSRVFAQVLSGSKGRRMDFDVNKRLPAYQAEIASAVGLARLSWRDRDLDPGTIQDQAQRALVDLARACGFDEFKRTVFEATQQKPPRPPPPPRAVFVNADTEDRQLAAQVSAALARLGIDCFLPLDHGKPEAVRLDRETNLRECDGLLLVYGLAGPDWVRHQILHGRKILNLREQPPAALAVLEGPPPEKQDLALTSSTLKHLDCRNGLNLDVLRDFAEQLSG